VITEREAKIIALQDITAVIGAANSQLCGVVPRFEASEYLSEADKKKVRRAWWDIELGLVGRMEKLRDKL
jgi:hypothetical protein